MADLYLTVHPHKFTRIEVASATGLFWIQAHFPPEYWDALCNGNVALPPSSAETLVKDAGEAEIVIEYK